MDAIPTIKIEMQGLKYQVIHAFSSGLDELKEYAIGVIDQSMNTLMEKGLETSIVNAVTEVMEDAIKNGIRDTVRDAVIEYYENGKGKQLVLDAIIANLERA